MEDNFIVDGGEQKKMRVNKTIQVQENTLVDLLCDVCGKSCRHDVCFKHPDYGFEFATIKAKWGYFSDSDGKSYKIEICEDCFYDMLAYFKLRCKTDGKALDPAYEY